MRWLARLLGSLRIAVPLLMAIAVVLGWGTFYESRFGTAAVQRFVYHAWWFQLLLGFLAVNLAVAALERYPWKRQHLPFVLAHLGIILILFGGILGGLFSIEGQLIIPEGQTEQALQLPHHVLVVNQPNPGVSLAIPTRFETQAWVHEPHETFSVPLAGRSIRLTVDRYYPDALVEETVEERGAAENPAVRVALSAGDQQDTVWLFARDPERFGIGWGAAHVVFLDAKTADQVDQLTGRRPGAPSRGVVSLQLPGMRQPRDIPVPDALRQEIAIQGTPYRITFKDYFPDFALTEHGIVNRSTQPHNPAVAFTLAGPEGMDAYLLFALHPEFQSVHGFTHPIAAQTRYTHAVNALLPPSSIGIIRTPAGALIGILTGPAGERQIISPLEIGQRYAHPSLHYQMEVRTYAPNAVLTRNVRNRGDDVRAEMVHVIGREGNQTAEAWLGLGNPAQLPLGIEPILVDYRPATRTLPVTIKLLDFRKMDYPGTQMASAFESDVELTDRARGLTLRRTIKMNQPLRYGGFSFYQSSYIPGPTETTVLSVRSDPGTPFVYAGFLIVIGGVASLFLLGPPAAPAAPKAKRRRAAQRSRAA